MPTGGRPTFPPPVDASLDSILATAAALAATGFTVDLAVDLARRRRPHVAAYMVGIAMFAVATWALVAGLVAGWNGASYRTFFLFGAILNIPFLALGSVFLVVGPRAGHVFFLLTGALSAVAVTLTTTVPFQRELPSGGIPHDIFPPVDTFGPRLLAVIGGGLGASLLILLSLVSVFRFWRANRRIVYGNLLILAGTLAAAWRGTGLALGEAAGFAASLLVASTLIWAGYRTTRGARNASKPTPPRVFLAADSRTPEAREHVRSVLAAMEAAGMTTVFPGRDLEQWGEVGLGNADLMVRSLELAEGCQAVVVDLGHPPEAAGVEAGWAQAKGLPVVVATPEGRRIPRPLRGLATMEVYYVDPGDIVARVKEALEPRRRP